MVIGNVIKKNEHMFELIMEVNHVKQSSSDSQAKKATSIIGKRVMLGGFWRRQDAFHKIDVGDAIQCSVDHPQQLSDHLTLVESPKKLKD